MNFPIARQHFYNEINQADEKIDLAKAALYIAQEEYPSINPKEYLNALDTMAGQVSDRLQLERYPLLIIKALNRYLYDDLGFIGNSNDYYNPCNSFLNEVINRRTGIPITLSLVYLEVSKRLDFPMVGIGMPGHFLIRPEFEDAGIFVDAFNGGEVLFEQDCQQRLRQIYGKPIAMEPGLLSPVSNRNFLTRLLTNLKMIYLNQKDLPRTLATVEKILMLFPDAPIELRDRGLIYYQMGKWTAASLDLETYLSILPNAEDSSVIRQLLKQLSSNI